MNFFKLLPVVLLSFLLGFKEVSPKVKSSQHPTDENTKIQVALLLDTSNSMDGLIEQAKSRLWNIVNTLTTLKYDGKEPQIEIALYEYGNDGLESSDNFIRQITPLTQDLDLISEQLFALKTNGGSEYCGAVINDALKKLTWDDADKSMKLIYIAGNEPFDQGSVSYKEASAEAKKQKIYVNTIFCGHKEEGERTFWKDGADLTDGKYFNIDPNQKVVYIPTCYDASLDSLNMRLNQTYIGYGRMGQERMEMQVQQDAMAESVAVENKVSRVVSKSKSNVYNNSTWDIIDRVAEDKDFLKNAKEEELPEEFKGLSIKEKEALVEEKAKERKEIQKQIGLLAKKREAVIQEELKNQNTDLTNDLGYAIEQSILNLAKANGFETTNE